MRNAGLKAGGRRLVSVLGAAALLALAGSVFATGTGTVDKASGWYPAGTNLTATATPGVYSVFTAWSGDTNGSAIAANQISFSVDGGMAITAAFSDRVTVTNSVPYWWLAGLDLTNDFEAVVTGDPDGDGFTTAEEYWSGTDPTNTASHLRIDQVVITSTNVQLVWAHARVDGAIPPISIQRRSSLVTGEWMHVDQKQPADGINTWDSLTPVGDYFRLCVTNMP